MTANSALAWFPAVQHLDVPKTRFVKFDWYPMLAVLDGEMGTEYPRVQREVEVVAEGMGYPLFVRTDLASAKHDGPSAYHVESKVDIDRVLGRTVEDNEMKFWIGCDVPSAFMLREFVPLDAAFTAWGGHPVASEWRVFVHGWEPVCHHFYWPEDSVWGASIPQHEWTADLRRREAEGLPAECIEMAREAGGRCQSIAPNWSVDFAKTQDRRWLLIDMATAEESWHPASCPHALASAPNPESDA